MALWDRGTLSPFKKRTVNLSNLFTGLRKLSLEGEHFFLEFFSLFFPFLPKSWIGFGVFLPREQRLVHAVISLLISVVVWEGLTRAVLCAGCSWPHVWFSEVLSKASTANVSGLVIFTHRSDCFCHRQCVRASEVNFEYPTGNGEQMPIWE